MDKPDLQTVLQTLFTLYSDTHHDLENHTAASKWLTQLQSSVHAWEIADQLLSLDNETEYINYFAAQTMHTKVCHFFKELPPDVHTVLRDSLLRHLTNRAGVSSPVTIQLVLALADLALQMEGWDTVVQDVTARFSGNVSSVPTLLDILIVLPEEVGNSVLHLGTNKRSELRQMLSIQCRGVLELLSLCLTHWPQDTEIKNRVFSCLGSWITLRAFPVDELAESPLMAAPFQTLHLLQVPNKLFESATDCICSALYVCEDVSNFLSLATVLQQHVNQLLPVYFAAVETESILRVNCLARIFTEMAESFLFYIIHYPDTIIGDIKTLDLLIHAAKHHDYEIVDMTFRVWYRLSEMLMKLNDKPTWNRFVDHINELINLLCKHCQLNEDLAQEANEIWYLRSLIIALPGYQISLTSCTKWRNGERLKDELLDETGDFADFRCSVIEVMRDIVFIVGSVNCFRKLYSVLCNPGQPWYVTEACLFLMQAIARSIKDDESQVLPIAIPVLLSIPLTSPYAVRATTLRLVGELSRWISKHPDTLNEVLKFLQDGLTIPALASISAVGIQSICHRCKGQMSHLFEGLLTIVQAADSLGITNNSVVGLMTGTVEILDGLPGDKVSQALRTLCNVSAQKLTEILQNLVPVHPHTISDPALWMDRLAAVFRSCDYKTAQGETHPGLMAAQELWPLLSGTLELYKSDQRIVERCCRCLRFILRCLRYHAAPLLSPLVNIAVSVYRDHHHSCFLYLGSIIADEFGQDSNFQPGLVSMTEAFAEVSFPLLSGPTGLIDHPDTIDDMFRLCARMVQRCPLAFLSSPIANTALDCGLASSLHMHRDAFSSVMKFFKDIIQCPVDNDFTEPDHSNITMAVLHIMSEHGQSLVTSLIQGFITLPPDKLTESTQVLWELLQKYKDPGFQWLETALGALDSNKMTKHQKIDFLQSVEQSCDQDSLEIVVRKLARYFR